MGQVNQIEDIKSREDIIFLVDSFYKKVLEDDKIGFIFNDVAQIDFDKHMPIMYDFWESTLFHRTNYKGNPMQVHLLLNEKVKLTKAHFDRWLKLFNETTDTNFTGKNAELAKTRALSIATVMQIKIHAAEQRK